MSEVVCVTGAGGFIAGHVVKQLLDAGHMVRGTCRDPSSKDMDYLRALPGASERLELFPADLLADGSFDKAVRGCTYVFHVASPVVILEAVDADLVIRPAREGTLNVLRACDKAGTVKRVVMTSSFAAIIFAHDHTVDPTPYTDKEWNDKSKPTPGDVANIYRTSKIEAEKAAWQYVKENAVGFSLVTICPPMVMGRWLPGYARLNDSSHAVMQYLDGTRKTAPDGGMGWIDVEDVARAHVAAMHSGAHGRYLIVNESHYYIDIARMLRERFPGAPIPTEKAPGKALKPEFDMTRASKDLGHVPSRSVAESLALQGHSFIDAGLLPKSILQRL